MSKIPWLEPILRGWVNYLDHFSWNDPAAKRRWGRSSREWMQNMLIITSYYTQRCRVNKLKKNIYIRCSCTPSSLVVIRCHPLSPVVSRCHPLPLVVAWYRPSSRVTTRCHPSSPFLTRYHSLSPVVTRCDLSPPVTIRFALRASHWYQTRRILVQSGEMLIWGFWVGAARATVYCVSSWVM